MLVVRYLSTRTGATKDWSLRGFVRYRKVWWFGTGARTLGKDYIETSMKGSS